MAPKAGPIGLHELLASIPSIIYGMWGLFIFAPVLSDYIEPAILSHLSFIPMFRDPRWA